MGKKVSAKTRYGTQIKMYLSTYQGSKAITNKGPLELEVKKPSPGAKPRNPAAHPWRHTGQAKGRIFKDIDPVPFDRKIDVPFGVCFNCWNHDHQQSNCPKPTLDDHCQNCGRIGVKVNTCPRCRRAYNIYRKKNKIQQSNDAKDTKVSPVVSSTSLITEKQKSPKLAEQPKDYEMSLGRSSITEDDYLSFDEHVSFDGLNSDEELPREEYDEFTNMIVDEGIKPCIITGEFLDNFLNLINAMQFLPIQKRTDVAQKFLLEHRRQLRQQSMEE